MKKPMTFALAIMVACSVWLFAEKREAASGTYLVTRFDFARYPASNQRLVEVKTNARMRGTRVIVGKAKAGAMPHRAYAVTVYLDNEGSRKEGPRGQITELREPGYGN